MANHTVRINPGRFSSVVRVPASKSHTIRQLLIASLADGVSQIINPLDSLDTRSCMEACRVFGAEIEEQYENDKLVKLTVKGTGVRCQGSGGIISNPNLNHQDALANEKPAACIDVGNSGTTLYLALAIAGLQNTPIKFTGDESIKKRSAAPLLDALAALGVSVISNAAEGLNGCVPITVQGPWKGGKAALPCPTSQYLSAILIAAPLAPSGVVTEIEVPLLNEQPYIEMTLSYLKAHGIQWAMYNEQGAMTSSVPEKGSFVISGGQSWKSINSLLGEGNWQTNETVTCYLLPAACSVPADFSSAAFPAAAAAITGNPVTLLGLDPEDTQGDKYFFEILREMGCDVEWKMVNGKWLMEEQKAERQEQRTMYSEHMRGQVCVVSRSKPLKGGTFDLNKTPDLLPAAAAAAVYAEGDTAFVNVAHARIKETDRIAVMAQELAKLGVDCTEKPDGLIVHGRGGLSAEKPDSSSPAACNLLPVACLDGHGDHRVVMALAVAALGAPFPVEITGAEAADVTFPGFFSLFNDAN